MVGLYMLFFIVIILKFFLVLRRFLNCLIMLENFKLLLLLFCLITTRLDNRMVFIALMVTFTVEVIVGLVVLTRVWECFTYLELGDF